MLTLRRGLAALVVLLVVPLAGCFVVSLEPLAGYMEKVPAKAPPIAGTWHMVESNPEDAKTCKAAAASAGGEMACTITFTARPARTINPGEYDGNYDVAMVSEKLATTKLVGQLVQLGPDVFLDFTAAQQTDIEDHLIPVHSFWKVTATEKSLRLVPLSPRTMKDLIAQPKPPVQGVYKDMVILTGSSETLQAFLQQHADDTKVFDAEGALQLVKP